MEEITQYISNYVIQSIILFILSCTVASMEACSGYMINFIGIKASISELLANIYGLMGLAASMVLVIIVLFRIIKNLISISSGSSEYVPTGQIIWDAIKSSIATTYLPWLLGFLTALLPLIQAGVSAATLDTVKSSMYTMIDNYKETGLLAVSNYMVAGFAFIFIGITNFFYYFTVAKYQVDLIILEVLTPIAAINKSTESKEFFTTWKRTIFSIFISMTTKVILYSVMCVAISKIMTTSAFSTWSNQWFMILIGCGICIIKEPEIVKSYKYSAGAGHSAIGVAKSAAFLLAK